MSIRRQVPMLCLRGSIANITMANITKEERKHIGILTERIANHPDLRRKRNSIIRGFKNTIGADYRDDRAVADAEYYIAIWRGVVNLFYHRKYTFVCKSCHSAHYRNTRDKLSCIDRQKIPCPNCHCVEITEVGELNQSQQPISGFTTGQFVPYAEYQKIAKQFTGVQKPPTCQSSIKYIPGDRFYDDPDSIIGDSVQLQKFFGEYAWNYCRQHIKENQRSEHKKTPRKIVGRADEIIFQELLALCRKNKLDYYNNTEPSEQPFDIYLTGLLTPPEFSVELSLLRHRALHHKVIIITTEKHISVLKNYDAPNITSLVSMPEHVIYQEDNEKKGDSGHTYDQISYRTVGDARMDPDDHIATVDTNDVMDAIRLALPDGTCKAVFDLDSNQGQIYHEFSQKFGDSPPKKCHMADFLGVAQRTIGICREQIKINMCYYGLTPK